MFDRWPTPQVALGWLTEPWRFLDGAFLLAGLLSALAWHRAGIVAAIFYQLALTPGELAWFEEHEEGGFWRSDRPVERVQVSREHLVADYGTQWLLGGAFLVFFAGATRVRVSSNAGLSVLNTGVPSTDVYKRQEHFRTVEIDIWAALIEDWNEASLALFRKAGYLIHDSVTYASRRTRSDA